MGCGSSNTASGQSSSSGGQSSGGQSSGSAPAPSGGTGVKLTYFNARGRGELMRLLFALDGVKYEDNRIEFNDWPKLKPKTPLGTLPVLEVNGLTITQSVPVARFIAKKHGLYGKSPMDQAIGDMVVEIAADIRTDLATVFFEKDEAKKVVLFATFVAEKLPMKLKFLEQTLKNNGGKFFIGNSLSWADVAIYDVFYNPLQQNPDLLDNAPAVKALCQKVQDNPKIKAYCDSRPDTAF